MPQFILCKITLSNSQAAWVTAKVLFVFMATLWMTSILKEILERLHKNQGRRKKRKANLKDDVPSPFAPKDMALTAKLLVSTHRHTHTHRIDQYCAQLCPTHRQKGVVSFYLKQKAIVSYHLWNSRTEKKLNTSLRPYMHTCCFFLWMVAVTLYTLKNSWTVLVLVCLRTYVRVTQTQNRLQWHSWLQWKKKLWLPINLNVTQVFTFPDNFYWTKPYWVALSNTARKKPLVRKLSRPRRTQWSPCEPRPRKGSWGSAWANTKRPWAQASASATTSSFSCLSTEQVE